ncbi:unnamed protein product [Triticum turgidum subsp. durum]|uniref:Protein kinase domain-containing protein n=1 Tax=Triticum turgidum subsp. durum TaxID=4567 RepID=A0A9R0YVC4_TRITD|nr:unnamed protein product [Triticum turgidum subsp. durum]
MLVYEYMARGSLEHHLFKNLLASLPWATRLKIAVGAAKGLAFLHEAETPVIYRDFKASNILLESVSSTPPSLPTPAGISYPVHVHTSISRVHARTTSSSAPPSIYDLI